VRHRGMTPIGTRAARLIATSSFVAIVILSAVALGMIIATLDRPVPPQWGFRGFEIVLGVGFGSVGALIAANRPENRLAWIMVVVSVVLGVQAVVDQYPVFADAANPPLPYAGVARWLSAWIWTVGSVGLVTFVPLLFPNGRLLSPRWRPAVALAIATAIALVGSIVLASRPLGPVPPTTDSTLYFERIGPIMAVGYVLLIVAATVSVTSAVVRYRRATGDEKLQMKWLAYTGVLLVPALAVGVSPFFIGQVIFIGVGVVAAVAIGISILHYRLYEIDVIINRSLVYGTMSAILAGLYAASMTLSQRLFTSLTGHPSDAAIVITTLVMASTFTPIKTRLQTVVDRRVKPAAVTERALDAATVGAMLAAAEDRLRQIAREELSRTEQPLASRRR
jgi:hypothetical protein